MDDDVDMRDDEEDGYREAEEEDEQEEEEEEEEEAWAERPLYLDRWDAGAQRIVAARTVRVLLTEHKRAVQERADSSAGTERHKEACATLKA